MKDLIFGMTSIIFICLLGIGLLYGIMSLAPLEIAHRKHHLERGFEVSCSYCQRPRSCHARSHLY